MIRFCILKHGESSILFYFSLRDLILKYRRRHQIFIPSIKLLKTMAVSTDSDDALAKETLRDEATEINNINTDPIRQQSQDLKECLQALGLSLEEDGYVKWRPDAQMHPRNWSVKRKIYDTGLIILLDLVTYVSLRCPHFSILLIWILSTAISSAGVCALRIGYMV
jgi:hypothetical protein